MTSSSREILLANTELSVNNRQTDTCRFQRYRHDTGCRSVSVTFFIRRATDCWHNPYTFGTVSAIPIALTVLYCGSCIPTAIRRTAEYRPVSATTVLARYRDDHMPITIPTNFESVKDLFPYDIGNHLNAESIPDFLSTLYYVCFILFSVYNMKRWCSFYKMSFTNADKISSRKGVICIPGENMPYFLSKSQVCHMWLI